MLPATQPDCLPEFVQLIGARDRYPTFSNVCVSLHDLRLYETAFNPVRYTIEHNYNLNRAQEPRTESDARSMAIEHNPEVIVAFANDYWTKGTYIAEIQQSAIEAWSRLFWVPVVSATNR